MGIVPRYYDHHLRIHPVYFFCLSSVKLSKYRDLMMMNHCQRTIWDVFKYQNTSHYHSMTQLIKWVHGDRPEPLPPSGPD